MDDNIQANSNNLRDLDTPETSHGLTIVIIGAGIGGLSTAIYLRQQGHKVVVLEQSRLANEVGAAMHLTPNATGLLLRIGIDPGKIGANLMERVSRKLGLAVYPNSRLTGATGH